MLSFMSSSMFLHRAFYEVMWKNVVQPTQATDDNVERCMLFAC